MYFIDDRIATNGFCSMRLLYIYDQFNDFLRYTIFI